MKVKLTNEQIFNIVYLLTKNYKDTSKYDKRFNFAVSMTISNLKSIATELIKTRKSEVSRFIEFESVRDNIIKSYAKSFNDGNPIFESDDISKKCQIDVDKLIESYRDAIDDRKNELDIYNEILCQEVEVDVIQCKFDAIPNDFDFRNLRIMVKETDDQLEEML